MASLGDMAKMMSRYKDIQKGMGELKEQLPSMVFSATGSKQLATVTVGGDFTVRSIEIVPGGSADRFELQQDLTEALNNAFANAKQEIASRMKEMTGGIELPGFF
ncbi:MAG: YbaB/EbfC family nucleoid-associated protein [Lentisphaeria bacterium]|nr:YbaB/EbfC family nucleoid-associated protein [Lentisphaeria bacterium]